jgi:hypothetical protein
LKHSDIVGAAIPGFHDTRAAARHHHELAEVGGRRMLRAEARKQPGLLIVAAVGLEVALLHLVLGCPGRAAGFGNAGAAKQDDRRADAALGKDHLGLQQLELQPHGSQLAARHEFFVVPGEAIGRGQRLRGVGHALGALEILVRMRQRRPSRLLGRIHGRLSSLPRPHRAVPWRSRD